MSIDALDDAPQTAAEKLMRRWDSCSPEDPTYQRLFDGEHRAEAERYLRAVDEVRRMSIRGSPEEGPRRRTSLQLAMARLEDELSHILTSRANDIEDELLSRDFSTPAFSLSSSSVSFGSFSNRGSNAEDDNELADDAAAIGRSDTLGSSSIGPVESRIWEFDLLPSDAVVDLRGIAEQMVAAGLESVCLEAFTRCRRAALDRALHRIGVDRLAGACDDVQSLPWEAAEVKIRRWIRAASTSIRVLFASERRLCELVFDGLGGGADGAFAGVAKAATLQLLAFPDAISASQRGPEKLFKILDLHDSLEGLLPDIETVFGVVGESSSIPRYAADIVSGLAVAARGILTDFGVVVHGQRSRTAVPNGNLHPMTRYIMNYINLITGYRQSLSGIVVSPPSSDSLPPGEAPDVDFRALEVQSSPLGMHLVWIVAILCSNLEGAAAMYREKGLSHVFLLNNFHYIVHKVKDSAELREVIGSDFLKVLTGRYQKEATRYQRAVWLDVLQCLRDEGIPQPGRSGFTRALRDRFRAFNAAFEETHRAQQSWVVPDSQLKEELRIAISVRLLPAYRGFFGRYRQYIESGRHPEQYIKFSVEDLEAALGDFFEGTAPPQQSHFHRWRSMA